MTEIHIIPIHDVYPHDKSKCSCGAEIKICEGGVLVVHLPFMELKEVA